jgi:hypothetical protein
MAMAIAVALCPSLGLGQAPGLAAVLAAAGTYTAAYEERFSAVVSDEQYDQRVFSRSASALPRTRKISSEMMFLWLANERAWLSVRNVVDVDGRAVKNSQERLDRLLKAEAPVGVARLRKMRDEGARFNIGSIRRNFNDPMFPLHFIEPGNQRRFTFALVGEETVDGAVSSKVGFEEQASPTFIQDGRRNVPSRGTMWIASGGAIMRTRLEVTDRYGGMAALIVVNYRRDPKLEMLVPADMHEFYRVTRAGSERIECEATYSNFRRFETSGRIVPN